jgi:hypothetical protein
MSKHKHKTQKQLDHAYDLYLRRKYGITLATRSDMDKKQNYKCGICRRPPKKNKLAVDHAHWIAKLNIKSYKKGHKWYARVNEFPEIKYKDRVRGKAIKAAKLHLLRLSVRGLLCWSCNTGIRKYFDDADALLSAAKYLKKHESKVGIKKPCRIHTK